MAHAAQRLPRVDLHDLGGLDRALRDHGYAILNCAHNSELLALLARADAARPRTPVGVGRGRDVWCACSACAGAVRPSGPTRLAAVCIASFAPHSRLALPHLSRSGGVSAVASVLVPVQV